MRPRLSAILLSVPFLTGACQTTQIGVPETPAVLENSDSETLAQIKSVLAAAIGRANVELGPGDLTKSSTISVLPPPLASREDRSMAMPVIFDLKLSGKKCYAVQRDTGDAFSLGVPCRAAP